MGSLTVGIDDSQESVFRLFRGDPAQEVQIRSLRRPRPHVTILGGFA